jgi:hypothetical protein
MPHLHFDFAGALFRHAYDTDGLHMNTRQILLPSERLSCVPSFRQFDGSTVVSNLWFLVYNSEIIGNNGESNVKRR